MYEETTELEHPEPEKPRVVGNYEIRTLLGVSTQRMYQIAYTENFPAPIAALATGGIWLETDVHDWISAHRPHLHQAYSRTTRQPPAKNPRLLDGPGDKGDRGTSDGQP